MGKATKFKWLGFIVILMLVFCLVVPDSQAKTVLKLAHCYPTTNHWARGAEHAAKIIKDKSNGELEIAIHTDSQLGTEEQITEAVIFGSIDIIITSANQLSNMFTPMAIFDMPFTFTDVSLPLQTGQN